MQRENNSMTCALWRNVTVQPGGIDWWNCTCAVAEKRFIISIHANVFSNTILVKYCDNAAT